MSPLEIGLLVFTIVLAGAAMQFRAWYAAERMKVDFLDAQLRQLGAVMKHEPPEVIDAPSETVEARAVEESVGDELTGLIARDLMTMKGSNLTEEEATSHAKELLEADAVTAVA